MERRTEMCNEGIACKALDTEIERYASSVALWRPVSGVSKLNLFAHIVSARPLEHEEMEWVKERYLVP